MNRLVLIVAATEGFIIKGIENKLKGIDIASAYSPMNVKELEKVCEASDLILIYTDDTIGLKADVLVYIKDHCSDQNKQVAVIGAKLEYEQLKAYIPETFIHKFYERPLDMDSLINDMEKYMEEDSQYARRKSILIVDDDVSYMSMISDWLGDEYRVSKANSGMEAITWLAKNKADLILLDYEMPITTGPQVLEMIKSSAATSDIPVIFLTGKGDKESIMKVLALKPAGYLLKTVDRRELKETLKKHFAINK